MKHIEFEHLINDFEGLLSAADGREVSEHLGICQACATDARKLGNFLEYVRREDFEQVSEAVTANLLNIYKPAKTAAKKDSFIKKLIADLVFDDWQMALNERFILSDTRQLLYRADNFDIDLRLNFVGEKCQVSGQVFPDCQPAAAELFSEGSSEKVPLNPDCEFVFPPIKNGIYGLRVISETAVIEISDISLLA